MLAQSVGPLEIAVMVIYLMVIGYLGWLGFRRTQSATDYLIAGRKTHPFVMAMSYGATFISTSAIVGFGGVAGMFGMSVLWLTFLNIFVGIFIAFVFLGGPTRHMGHRLDAHTFPELLGRRYESKFIQIFAGLIIFCFIPLYAAAVLIGGSAFIAQQFLPGVANGYTIALLVFSVLIAAYVVVGGLKGVMYTDALQASIMFVGMLILLIAAYAMGGGVTRAHAELTELGNQPNLFSKIGFTGWTSMPKFGWGEGGYDLWWIVIGTITLGVGIGVLAQPQLVVRFMTVKSKTELNRAVLVGGIFILIMTGVAFTVGSLSNVYFLEKEEIQGTLVAETPNGQVIVKRDRGINPSNPANPDVIALPAHLLHVDRDGDGTADVHLVGSAPEKVQAIMPKAEVTPADYAVGDQITVKPHATAYFRAIVKHEDGTYECMTSRIIPTYIGSAMPRWFGLLFLLTLLAAAMSTLSSQFHVAGTSIGRDVYEQATGRHGRSVQVTRVGIMLGIIIAMLISYYARGGYIIARATAIFFGLCGSAFLAAFVGGLFFKRATKAGAIASMMVGFSVTSFWLLFIKDQEARAVGVCKAIFDKYSMLLGHPNWSVVDPMLVALPLSAITMIVVSLLTRPPGDEHLRRCFREKS